MLRLILGVVLGVLVGMVVTGVVEGMGHTIFPPPPGVDLTDPAQLSTVMSKIPLEAKVAVLLAWFLGVLAGASTGNLVAGRRAWAGRIVALALFAFSAWTMWMIPHPLWFMASAPVFALLAAFAAERAFGRPRA
ncbi:hypothetical protein [Phenylobacterium sp.]|uniref:hypothetical protein n=1 Tax=Phenylobacterium sp. TaxID=1871053 RepID=UPI002FC96AE9